MEQRYKSKAAKIRHNLISEFDDKISHFIREIKSSVLCGRTYDCTYDLSDETTETKCKIYYGISCKRRDESCIFSIALLDYTLSGPFVLDQVCPQSGSNTWHTIKNTLGEVLRIAYTKQWSDATQEFDITCYKQYITSKEFSEKIHTVETKMLQSFKTQSSKDIADQIDLLDIPDDSYDVILIEQFKFREQKIRANFKKLLHHISCKYIEITDEQNTEINDNNLIEHIRNIARPPVHDSELLQMRHVTPYSFMSRALQNLFQNTFQFSYKYIADQLLDTIKSFPPRSGLCIKDFELSKISTKIGVYLKVITNHNKYCFIYDTHLVDQSVIDRVRAESLHREKWPKVIDYFGKIIENIAQHEPNHLELFYSIVLYILIMFNQRLHAAFPEEGNTVNYEIRLYKTPDEAKKSLSKNYTLLSHDDFAKKLHTLNTEDKQEYNRKIAVVDNEGAVVDKTIKVLNKLQEILKLNIPPILAQSKVQGHVASKLSKKFDELISSYNKINESIIGDTTIFTSHYYSKLERSNFVQNYVYHIVRHLYDVFDCKPLENKVLVEASPSEDNQDTIEVWRLRVIKQYGVMDGNQYREREIKNTKNKYTIAFRHNIPEDEFQSILSKAIVKHIIISSILFPQLFQISLDDDNNSDKICKEFIKHTQNHYQYGDEFYHSTFRLYNDHCSDSNANTSLSTVLSGELHHQDI